MDQIAVLMSTYNGARHLSSQLDSIEEQSGVDVSLYVRDDGSTDATQAILQGKADSGVLHVEIGENFRPARSFLNLLFAAPKCAYYAFADQDDIWQADKLRRAIDTLAAIPDNKPALYFSNVTLADADCNPLRPMLNTGKPPGIGNALIQCFSIGATMVMNKAAREILISRGMPLNMVMHDWWTYLVVASVGEVFYDPEPSMLYRQHDNNVFGGVGHAEYLRGNWRSILRSRKMLQGQDQARDLIAMYGDMIDDHMKIDIQAFAARDLGPRALVKALQILLG